MDMPISTQSSAMSVASAPGRPMSLNSEQATFLERVKNNEAVFTFSEVVSEIPGHRLQLRVFSDALKLDGIRIAVNANTNQYIADVLNCSPLTAKIADLIWQQKQTRIPPFPRGSTTGMASHQAMVEHSAKIDAFLAKMPEPHGLCCTVGKLWVLDNALLTQPGMAMNYGWHYGTDPSYQGVDGEVTASRITSGGKLERVIQGRGTRHDGNHVDYSQVCVLVYKTCILDGNPVTLESVMTDPNLASLVNHDGVLKVLRQPTAK
jgi:hypothetical protein